MTSLWSVWRATIELAAPLSLKRGTLTQRECLLLRYEDSTGVRWGEVAPLPQWSIDSLDDNLAVLAQLEHCSPTQLLAHRDLPPAFSTGLALMILTQPHDRHDVMSNVLVTDSETIPADALAVKLKVGQRHLSDDIQRINHLSARLKPEQKIRLDANQSWDYDDVAALIQGLDHPQQIAYIEEPLLPNLTYEQWSDISPVSFAFDERLMGNLGVSQLDSKGLAALVIKPTLLGWTKTSDWVALAQSHSLDVVISSSFESPIGLRNLQRFARQVQPNGIHGLATADYLSCHWQLHSSPPLGGQIALERLL